MELPFEKTTQAFWEQKLCTPVIQEETQECRLPDTLPDVGRVIAAWGQAVLRGKQWRRGHVGLSGGVMVWVLYDAEDGSGPRRLESWVPFDARADHSQEGEDGVIRAQVLLSSVDARSLSARKLMLRCRVGLMVQTLIPKQAELCAPGELPEDVQVLDRIWPMVLTREVGERSFPIEETIPMPQGLPQPERVIYSRMNPRVLEQKVLGSRAVFRGVGEMHLLCRDSEGKLFCADLEVPFAQYLELEGDYEEAAEVRNLLCLTSLEAEPAQEGGVRVRCGLVTQYIVNAPTVIRCLEDAYSTQRELELVTSEAQLPVWLDEQLRQVELAEQVAGEEVPVDAIFFPDLPQFTPCPGGSEIRLGGTFQTLNRTEDGALQSRQVRTEKREQLLTNCDTVPCTWLRGGTGLRREGSGWSVETKLDLSLASLCRQTMRHVTTIRAGDSVTPDPERPSVILRRVKSQETLWDIAKYCGSTVTAIQRLNRLDREPEDNRLLLIPVI